MIYREKWGFPTTNIFQQRIKSKIFLKIPKLVYTFDTHTHTYTYINHEPTDFSNYNYTI